MRALLAVSLALLLLCLGDEVMDVDPAQDADVASRIARSGRWLQLEDFNGPFINKPPLMLQAQAVAMLALGPTSVAARLPALLFAMLAVLGTGLLGARLGGRALGLRAAGLLGTSVALHHMVADPKVDLALVAMTTWAVLAFVVARERPWVAVAGWGFTALAVLAKGPIGLAMVAFSQVHLLRSRPRLHLPAHLLGLGLFAALVTPFYASRPDSLGFLLWTQGPGRLLGASSFRDATTPLYVLHTAAWALLPMGPLAVLALWRRRGFPVATWWLALTCLAVAFAQFKLPQYVYWVAPPAALLGAQALEDLTLPRWPAVGLAGLAAALGVLVLGFAFPPSLVVGVGLGVALLVPVVVAARAPAQLGWATSTLGFLAVFHLWLHPSLLEFQPSRELGALVQQLEPGRTELPVLGAERTFSLAYYAQRALPPVSAEEVRVGLLVTTDEGLAALSGAGRVVEPVSSWPAYHVSLPRLPFLRASTRASVVKQVRLVRVVR
jgi:4-amino-4-deoxy-L-arabinose transferase-like glycosyltransferase